MAEDTAKLSKVLFVIILIALFCAIGFGLSVWVCQRWKTNTHQVPQGMDAAVLGEPNLLISTLLPSPDRSFGIKILDEIAFVKS